MAKTSMSFSVLIKKEDGLCVAHCLELDIVATADNNKQAVDSVIDLIMTQLDYALAKDNMDYFFHSAPKEAWQDFFTCPKLEVFTRDFITRYIPKKSPRPSRIITTACSAESLCCA